MFKFLKEKISGWLGKAEVKSKKKKPGKVNKSKKIERKVEKSNKKFEKKKYSSKNIKSSKKEKDKLFLEKSQIKSFPVSSEELSKEVENNKLESEAQEGEAEELVEEVEEEVSEEAEELVEEVEEEDKESQEGEAEELVEEVGEEAEKKVEEKRGFFGRLISRISNSKLTNEQFDEFFEEFELTLLENNVALEVVDAIRKRLSEELIGKEVKKKDAEKKVLDSLKESIYSVLIEPPNIIDKIKENKGVYTILFFGINGTGKTTSIAKIAYLLKKRGISCVMAAADTFRAASIEQLRKHGEALDVNVIAHDYGSDPAAVAFDARKYAENNGIKVVLIDTAGRMYTKDNLLKEMDKIVRIAKPDLKIFVGESITGNDVVEQAKSFNEAVGFDGIILSKADIDDRAGAILSAGYVTGKPIYFLGIGQGYEDIIVFSREGVLKNLGLE
jgi:fused signal recognition particle receptor